MDRRSWMLLLALAAIWGASYMFIKIGLREMSPVFIAWLRVALGALVLVPLAASAGALGGLRPRLALIGVLASVQAAGPFALIALGQQEIPSGMAGVLIASAPLFTALLALRLDASERVSGLRLLGVVAGLAGVGLLLGVDVSDSRPELLGGLAVLAAGLGYAIGGFIVKLRFTGTPPLGLAALVMVGSTMILAPFAALDPPAEMPGPGPLAAVAVLGLLGTGVAFALFYELMSRVGPSRSFIVTYLAPVFAIAYGGLLLDEAVSSTMAAGLVMILAGSWLAVEGRLRRRPPTPVP